MSISVSCWCSGPNPGLGLERVKSERHMHVAVEVRSSGCAHNVGSGCGLANVLHMLLNVSDDDELDGRDAQKSMLH